MRELTVRIRFTTPCLGNVKDKTRQRFLLPRTQDGTVMFLASWHRANLKFAAQTLNRHQDEVDKILWDVQVDGQALHGRCWTQRFYRKAGSNREHYSVHEAFIAGQVIGINCVVPEKITDEDFWQLMSLAGKYRGLSPFLPCDHGIFEVVSIRLRRRALPVPADDDEDLGLKRGEPERSTQARSSA